MSKHDKKAKKWEGALQGGETFQSYNTQYNSSCSSAVLRVIEAQRLLIGWSLRQAVNQHYWIRRNLGI